MKCWCSAKTLREGLFLHERALSFPSHAWCGPLPPARHLSSGTVAGPVSQNCHAGEAINGRWGWGEHSNDVLGRCYAGRLARPCTPPHPVALARPVEADCGNCDDPSVRSSFVPFERFSAVRVIWLVAISSPERRAPAENRVRGDNSPPHLSITLPDGRSLAYASHGPSTGRPLLYIHGTPGSKHNWYLNHDPELLAALDLRVLAIDRPGVGGSTFLPGRTLRQWPEDVREFADRLGLDRFALLGYSCGAPFALACSVHLANRVTHTSIVSGYADVNHHELANLRSQQNLQVLRLGLEKPWLSRSVYATMGAVARVAPRSFVRQALATMPPADVETLSDPSVGREFVAMVLETLRQGPKGVQHDSAIVSSPWDLPLERISGRVALWHGTEDRNAPAAMGRHHARRIPDSELREIPGEGHLSLVRRHIRDILRAISD